MVQVAGGSDTYKDDNSTAEAGNCANVAIEVAMRSGRAEELSSVADAPTQETGPTKRYAQVKEEELRLTPDDMSAMDLDLVGRIQERKVGQRPESPLGKIKWA